jgi:hypothetical protein
MNTPDGWSDRFASKVSIGAPDDCWPWTAVKIPGGYGQFWLDGRMHNAHRVAFLMTGRTIPFRYVVMHSCDNRLCCNPAHLKAAYQIVNIHDALKKGRFTIGERHGCAILAEREVLEIRERNENATKAAKKYGVAVATIRDIRSRRSWTHI